MESRHVLETVKGKGRGDHRIERVFVLLVVDDRRFDRLRGDLVILSSLSNIPIRANQMTDERLDGNAFFAEDRVMHSVATWVRTDVVCYRLFSSRCHRSCSRLHPASLSIAVY